MVSMLPASSSYSFSAFPWFFVIFVILAVVGQISRARRRTRARQQNPQQFQQQPPNVSAFDAGYQPPPANFQAPAPYQQGNQPPAAPQTTPPQSYPPAPGNPLGWQQATPAQPLSGFASSRWASEQDLKQRLNELDQRRRAGQINAEQYQVERDAIFRDH